MMPSSFAVALGSSPTRRTTTPSSRSVIPRARFSGSTATPGCPGAAPGYLDQPDDAYLLESGTITVADASNNRIFFISPQGQVIGPDRQWCRRPRPAVSIAYPNGDTPLADGNVLVSEINGSWIDEYTPTGRLVWTVHIPTVNYPSDPQQVGPDLYLMTDYDPPAEGVPSSSTGPARSSGSTMPDPAMAC